MNSNVDEGIKRGKEEGVRTGRHYAERKESSQTAPEATIAREPIALTREQAQRFPQLVEYRGPKPGTARNSREKKTPVRRFLPAHACAISGSSSFSRLCNRTCRWRWTRKLEMELAAQTEMPLARVQT